MTLDFNLRITAESEAKKSACLDDRISGGTAAEAEVEAKGGGNKVGVAGLSQLNKGTLVLTCWGVSEPLVREWEGGGILEGRCLEVGGGGRVVGEGRGVNP